MKTCGEPFSNSYMINYLRPKKKSLLVLILPLGKKRGERAIFIFFLLFFFVNIYLADLTSPPRWVSSDIRYSGKKIIVETRAVAQMKGHFMLIKSQIEHICQK